MTNQTCKFGLDRLENTEFSYSTKMKKAVPRPFGWHTVITASI